MLFIVSLVLVAMAAVSSPQELPVIAFIIVIINVVTCVGAA